MADTLTGDVEEFQDGRWRVVHVGEHIPEVDRRRFDFNPMLFPPVENSPTSFIRRITLT